ncbi:hypothetical protein [Salmonella phage NINP13076]|nr:hypothetical protein [Salmonella phage NINP13076]
MLKKDSSHNGLDEKSYQMRVIITYSHETLKNACFIQLITCVINFGGVSGSKAVTDTSLNSI